ncbi:hypothetical protein ACIBTW_26130 [Micromonospora parva]|uniref:hypothetical protein n=1 Tax=Micromonospora parva TaxID=1464048 RepID=UPI003796B19E
MGAALHVVDGGVRERLDDLWVVVECVERSPQDPGQLLQPDPQLRLGVHPVDVQLAAVEVHPYAGVDLEQVGHSGAQRQVSLQAVDRQSDGVDGDLRNVEQDVRVPAVDVPVRLPLLPTLAHALPPRLRSGPVVRAVGRGYPLSGRASRP